MKALVPLLWLVLSVLAVIGAHDAKAKLLNAGIIVGCMAVGVLIGAGFALWGHDMEIGAHVAASLMFWVGAVGAFHCVVPALAQPETLAVEVFGGYQFSHFTPSINANGWNAAVTGNINRWFGITGEVSGSYKYGGHMYTYMVGPTFSARTERVTPFVHALFGGASAGGNGDSGNAFAMAFGGGLDVNAGDHLALRLV